MIEISLTDGIHKVLVDDDVYEKLDAYRWHLITTEYNYYAQRWTLYPDAIMMHREIMDAPQGMLVHHKNGNGLDNRKENLKVITYSEHNRLHASGKGITSDIKGVHYEFSRGKWKAVISIQGVQVFLGRFNTEEEAAVAYKTAYVSNFGVEE